MTATKDALLSLAERVEVASGADRELDRAVMKLLNLPPDYSADWGPRDNCKPAPFEYTASIDAAMTLVPEGIGDEITAMWSVEAWASNGVYPEHVRATAWVWGAPRVYAATPALALLGACLRAHAEIAR
jgi:hypothetical protein